MIGLLCFVLAVLASPFKSKIRLEAENAVLRHQLIVLRRKLRGRVQLANSDRWFFVQLYRWFPSILKVLTIIRPETLVRWHQAGFRSYWRWKSRSLGGRPQIDAREMIALVSASSSARTIVVYRCVPRCWPTIRQAWRSERPYFPRMPSTACRRRSGLTSFPRQRP
jgi:hypothetical protein